MLRLAASLLFISFSTTAVAQSKPQRQTNFTVKQSDFELLMKQMEAEAKGRVGVAAAIVETGEAVNFGGNERFPMQSVYKLPIGMAALAAIDAGTLRRDKLVKVAKDEYVSAQQRSPLRDQNPNGAEVSVEELLRLSVSESDGSASDVLLRIVGGVSAVQSYVNTLGVTGMMIRNTEKEIGAVHPVQYDNWATPLETVKLLRQVQLGRGLSKESRTYLLKLLTETPTGLARLKGQLPPGTLVAHKTGTSLTVEGKTAATNDVGLITLPNGKHLAIAVFVSDATADQATREGVIAKIARKLWERWAM